jgi:serine/threonine protein kinase
MNDLLKDSTPEDREALFDSLNEDLLQVFDEDIINLDDEFKFPLQYEAENEAPGEDSIRFLKEIGRGGMKILHKCEVIESGKLLAIARMRNEGDSAQVERFMREAKITKMLKHKNIIELYDYGISEKSGPYMAMRYFDGVTLADILQEISLGNKDYIQAYPLKRRLQFFKDITAAIRYAHEQGVVHLDIKPENVLVRKDGRVLIYDWGLARILPKFETIENFSLASQSGVYVKGSPGYMAPEQIVKKEKTVATDIYQLGGLLYSILFYRSPVVGQDVDEILEKTVAGQLDLPEGEDDNDLVRLIGKALEMDPSDRYQSVAEMMNSFNEVNATFVALEKRQKVIHQRQVANYLHEAQKYREITKETKRQVLFIAVAISLMFFCALYFAFNNDLLKGDEDTVNDTTLTLPADTTAVDAESSYYKIQQ